MAPCSVLLCVALAILLVSPLTNTEGKEIDLPMIQDVKELCDSMLRNYSKHILPSEKLPFNVSVGIILHALGEIDELEEMLSYVFWLTYTWKDKSISWDRNHTDIAFITLSWNDVWTPVFRVTNPHAEVSKSQNVDRSYDTVFYSSDGDAYFTELMATRTTCDLDMTYYPFDIQTCSISMFIVGHLYFPFNIKINYVRNRYDDTDHGSWTLINQTAVSYSGGFVIKFMFQRKPLFLLINIFLPVIVLAFLTPVVFILPKKSGERVSYSITMLLAISVYMIIVSEHLPQNSQPMPLISIMIFVCYILDALIVFVVIINTNIKAIKDNVRIPNPCKNFVLLTRKVLMILNCSKDRNNEDGNFSEDQDKDFGSETLMEIEDDNENSENASAYKNHNETVDIKWKDLSNVIDKWCFFISYSCKIIIPIVFFSICKAKSRKELTSE